MLAMSIERSKQHWELVGEEKGLQKGRQEGLQKGIQKGQFKTAIDSVLEVLEIRFSNTPSNIKQKIKNCDSLNKLKQAHRTAVLINDINEFTI